MTEKGMLSTKMDNKSDKSAGLMLTAMRFIGQANSRYFQQFITPFISHPFITKYNPTKLYNKPNQNLIKMAV